jgi:hypothetical protein
VRQLVAAVVLEPGRRAGPPAQQPVERARVQVPEPGAVVVDEPLGALGVLDRLLQPRGGLAGGRGQRDPQRPSLGPHGLLLDQR